MNQMYMSVTDIKMIFLYLYIIRIKSGTIIRTIDSNYEVTEGFDAYWIDLDRIYKELGEWAYLYVCSFFQEKIQTPFFIGEYLYNIPSSCILTVKERSFLGVFKLEHRVFSDGKRLIAVTYNTVEIMKKWEGAYRISDAFQKLPISFFSCLSFVYCPRDMYINDTLEKDIIDIKYQLPHINYEGITLDMMLPYDDYFLLHMGDLTCLFFDGDKHWVPNVKDIPEERSYQWKYYTIYVSPNKICMNKTYADTLFEVVTTSYSDIFIFCV